MLFRILEAAGGSVATAGLAGALDTSLARDSASMQAFFRLQICTLYTDQ